MIVWNKLYNWNQWSRWFSPYDKQAAWLWLQIGRYRLCMFKTKPQLRRYTKGPSFSGLWLGPLVIGKSASKYKGAKT